jgi:anti-sigma factor RsiW
MTLEDMLTDAGITKMEIMEYADGVLAPARRPVVRAALAKYPELMQLLETFIFTRDRLKDVYDEVLELPPHEPCSRSCWRPCRRLHRDDGEGLVPSSTHGLGLPPGRRSRSRRCARSYSLHGCCSASRPGTTLRPSVSGAMSRRPS